ncbi:MAG: DUF4350 domain-containing protein [Methanofollis sp.]|uniref:DUF4350 domain-containing protein n=1 Tax=Methanofollis sp. TaxID=2052835 RepID=UPI002637CB19|nr:DUF4350 domain-containing protein [Methanofollis sp.]MDD4255991.1 DUF4350 domain-containing protein [Methanofollis sp.]
MRGGGALVAVAALLVLLLVAGVHLTTSYDQYSRYNVQWNGTSSFFTLLEEKGVHEIRDPVDLTGYDNATLLVIAPSGPPDPERVAAWRAFLARNNTIILFDDFGAGDAALRALGASIRILPGPVVSVDREYSTPAAVTAYPVENASLLLNVSAVLFDRPAALEGGDPLLQTSFLSWVDADGNTTIDGDEVIGRSTVCAREKVAGGELIVIGDPGLFLNSMAGTGKDNRQFVGNLLTLRPVLLVDQGWSRTATAGPVPGAVRWVKERPIFQIGIAALFIFAAACYSRKWNGK